MSEKPALPLRQVRCQTEPNLVGISGDASPMMHPAREPKEDLFINRSLSYAAAKPLQLRAAESAPALFQAFSDISNPDTIRSLCHQKVPGWSNLPKEDIAVDQLLEGLSNQLFKVYLGTADPKSIPCVLFRIQGEDVSSLYDPAMELKIYNMLASYHIAPRIYDHGEGWRIEEWHFSVSLPTSSMRNPSIMAQVAAGMGRLHKLSATPDFPKEIYNLPPVFIERLKQWGDGCEQAAQQLLAWDPQHPVKDVELAEMLAEREWLEEFVLADNPKLKGSGLDVVFSHWDSQEGNILQTHYGVRFIDFEYSRMEYQSYDIANYFVECAIDYRYNRYPFYKYTSSDFPVDWEQRLFCSIYLSEYLESSIGPDTLQTTLFVDRVNRFTLVSDLCWAFWSVIRAPQAPTQGEFDFIHSAKARFDMYKMRKRELLSRAERSPPSAPSSRIEIPGQAPSEPTVTKEDRIKKTPIVLGSGLTMCGVLLGVAVTLGMAKALRR